MPTKYIITTGGVMSGLGKGLVSASLGKLLQAYGYSVTMIKMDPYLNVDAGTMNPYEHGEVFVLDDGGECDMDLGTYERFIDIPLTRDNNITTGKAYKAVIDKERKGEYLGQTVQIIPHVTGMIQEMIRKASEGFDISIVELGGTVGDIESAPFLEAVRQLHLAEGDSNVIFVHVTLVPVLSVVGEQKTKPTQHSVQRLQEAGVQPDLILCRATNPLDEKTREKIANFCNVQKEYVISDPDSGTLYEIPLTLEKEDISQKVMDKLGLKKKNDDMEDWTKMVERMKKVKKTVKIAMAGKYTSLNDSYASILESLRHAAAANNAKLEVRWIETTDFEKDPKKVKILDEVDGILVPYGWGSRGAEGKILLIKYARENKIPFFGLCYGFQMAAIEYARNVCGLDGANSTECDENCKHPIIILQPEQLKIKNLGGTLRLGSWPCKLEKGTLAYNIYNKEDLVHERHRHRYEMNPEYIKQLEEGGLVFSGKSPDTPIMEMLELPGHPFFLGTQFHPEFKSRPLKPAPVFYHFVKACVERT